MDMTYYMVRITVKDSAAGLTHSLVKEFQAPSMKEAVELAVKEF